MNRTDTSKTARPIPVAEVAQVDAADLLDEEIEQTAAPPKDPSWQALRAARLLLFALRDARTACRMFRDDRDHGKQCGCTVCFCMRSAGEVVAGIMEGLKGILGGPDGIRETLRKRLAGDGKMVWVRMRMGEHCTNTYLTREDAEEELELSRSQGKADDCFIAAFPKQFVDLNEWKPWSYFDYLYRKPFEERGV
jgi:hypothetical protein